MLDFNPLHHEGGDAVDTRFKVVIGISIHSTTRVETMHSWSGWQTR